jgi:putative ABC transport system permease protein
VVANPRTLEESFVSSLDQQRLMATLVGFFGAVALILAAVGLYGMMAHLTSQRTAEVGIRLALGARPVSILVLIVRQGLRLVAFGGVLGVFAAIAGSRLVRTQLFGIAPTDPTTYLAVALLLAVVSVVACVIPARRAMRVDPIVALRQ